MLSRDVGQHPAKAHTDHKHTEQQPRIRAQSRNFTIIIIQHGRQEHRSPLQHLPSICRKAEASTQNHLPLYISTYLMNTTDPLPPPKWRKELLPRPQLPMHNLVLYDSTPTSERPFKTHPLRPRNLHRQIRSPATNQRRRILPKLPQHCQI